ncbi:MAG: C2H2-type zinc finger protein [Thermoplasmata archaeon]
MPYVEYDEVEASCSECGRIFRSEEALERHQKESHAIEDVTRRPPVVRGRSGHVP